MPKLQVENKENYASRHRIINHQTHAYINIFTRINLHIYILLIKHFFILYRNKDSTYTTRLSNNSSFKNEANHINKLLPLLVALREACKAARNLDIAYISSFLRVPTMLKQELITHMYIYITSCAVKLC